MYAVHRAIASAITCGTGPAEHRGTVRICSSNLLAATLTLFQPGEGRLCRTYRDVPTRFQNFPLALWKKEAFVDIKIQPSGHACSAAPRIYQRKKKLVSRPDGTWSNQLGTNLCGRHNLQP